MIENITADSGTAVIFSILAIYALRHDIITAETGRNKS
jgi:hypothetical protein